MKKFFTITLAGLLVIGLASCGEKKSEVQKIIEEAQTMTYEEILDKAYEESKNKTLQGLGNSSRGKTAGETFVAMMKEKYSDYAGEITWSQPKENSIFQMLESDSKSSNPQFGMTLIQDGAQIKSKMIDTGILLNYVPKEWKEAKGTSMEENGNPLALQTLSKVFMYNVADDPTKKVDNVWKFVADKQAPMFMGLQSEPIGFNFLLMLTSETYIPLVKGAFDALSAEEKAYFQPKVDALKAKAKELKLAKDAEYSLAWIQLWVNQMNVQTDDGPICNELVKKSAVGKSGLLVYSKLRSVSETEEVSVNNVKVAALEDGYVGFGGYAYKHYLQMMKTSPLPWTSIAFINYMVTSAEGFQPWGKDMGGYSSNPNINQDHSKDGWVDDVNQYPNKNDAGYDWWTSLESGKGRLVVEDPTYAAKVSFTVGSWIETLKGYK